MQLNFESSPQTNTTPSPGKPKEELEKIRLALFKERQAFEWNLHNRGSSVQSVYADEVAKILEEMEENGISEEDYKNWLKDSLH